MGCDEGKGSHASESYLATHGDLGLDAAIHTLTGPFELSEPGVAARRATMWLAEASTYRDFGHQKQPLL